MSLKSPASAEARLQKLKEEIALRKQQRQQKLLSSPHNVTATESETGKQSSTQAARKTPQKDEDLETTVPKSEEDVSKNQKKNKKKSAQIMLASENIEETKTPSPKKNLNKSRKRKSSNNVSDVDLETNCEEVLSEGNRSMPELSPRKKKKKQNQSAFEQSTVMEEDSAPLSENSFKRKKANKNKKQIPNSEELTTETDVTHTAQKSSKSKKGKICDAEKLLNEIAEEQSSKTKKKKVRKVKVEKKDQLGSDSDSDSGVGKDDNEPADDRTDEQEEEELVADEDPNAVGGFSILGNFTNESTKAVKRKLPDWLANPSIIRAGLKRRPGSEVADNEDEDSDMKILDDGLRQKLHENGIHSFFPVQKQFIPEIWEDLKFSITGGRLGLRPRDICVSAPTGSGKTLAYVLPIIQCLKQRMVPHIFAVVVLPVRDLAEQVYNVFSQYCSGTPLKVGLVVGKTTFSVEQETLVKKRHPGLYHSLVDILVATPGRLVDHINSTPGFDLSHLRFLVIDEADRMMEDIKHDWLSVVETAAYTCPALAYFPLSRPPPGPLSIASAQCTQMPLQKLLFSATLSHNPEKLERLKLFMPRLMTSVVSSQHHTTTNHQPGEQKEEQEDKQAEDTAENADGGFVGKYTTPEGLTEYLVESSAAEKPLVMLHFLHNLKFRNVICFTNSVESTHRLCLLVKLFGGLKVKEFSSRMQGERRKKVLKQFSKGKIDLLVCSDAMARGMDVDSVKYVISYDNPPYIKTYIHRVGRTARAGRAGTAISLLEKKEFFHFKQMMREAGKWPKIKEMKLGRQVLKPLVEPFQEALSKLPQIIKEEKKKHPTT